MTTHDYRSPHHPDAGHTWVGAALVGMGLGDNRRAEHAARTGKHVVAAGTQIKVLEVYCERCRVRYSHRARLGPCFPEIARAS